MRERQSIFYNLGLEYYTFTVSQVVEQGICGCFWFVSISWENQVEASDLPHVLLLWDV
jgi:hypothetical protein